MIWVDALQAVLDTLTGDMELVTLLGGEHVYRNGEHNEYRVPAIYWTGIWNRIDENTEPFEVQFDIYANNINDYIDIERRVRRLLHRDTPQTLGTILMFTQLSDARDHADGEDVIHRSLDFRFETVRDRVEAY